MSTKTCHPVHNTEMQARLFDPADHSNITRDGRTRCRSPLLCLETPIKSLFYSLPIIKGYFTLRLHKFLSSRLLLPCIPEGPGGWGFIFNNVGLYLCLWLMRNRFEIVRNCPQSVRFVAWTSFFLCVWSLEEAF